MNILNDRFLSKEENREKRCFKLYRKINFI